MNVILTSTLYEQINERNKDDGDFKSQAYQAMVDKLRVDLNMSMTIDHGRNRIRVWKRHYATITEIRAYKKFKWDEERKMVVIPVEELDERKKYCRVCYVLISVLQFNLLVINITNLQAS